MSQVKISGNASGTGVFTVASPNSNNTQTLTLPDATATLVGDTATQTLSNKTISGNLNMTGGTKYQVGGVTTNALAWVNFNGQGTVAIRSSYNVSSITDNGTGDYTINFATALSDANYNLSGTSGLGSSTTAGNNRLIINAGATTSGQRINVQRADTGTMDDMPYNSVLIFGN